MPQATPCASQTAFAVELARRTGHGKRYPAAFAAAALHCLPLAAPLVPTLMWQGDGQGSVTREWFNTAWKIVSVAAALRDRWMYFDLAAVLLLVAVILLCLRSRRFAVDPGLALGAALLFAAFLLLPQILFSSSRTDIRVVPYALAAAILAIRLSPAASARFAALFALAGLAFLVARLGGNALSQFRFDASYRAELAALAHVPRGARLASFVGTDCTPQWATSRLEHIPGLAIVRREAFSNEQWAVSSTHMLRVLPPWTAHVDPTHFVTERRCSRDWQTIADALAHLPRAHFGHVWLIRPPPHDPALVAGWTPLWRHGTSVLYALPPP